MNPRSECLRTAMPNAHVANFLQGRQDTPTLLGTIDYLDATLEALEDDLEEYKYDISEHIQANQAKKDSHSHLRKRTD